MSEEVAPQNALVSRDGNGRFMPGTYSANPGGKPAIDKRVRQLIDDNTYEGVAELIRIALDPRHDHQVVCLRDFLNRALGKPIARLALEGVGDSGAEARRVDMSRLSNEEFKQFMQLYAKAQKGQPK